MFRQRAEEVARPPDSLEPTRVEAAFSDALDRGSDSAGGCSPARDSVRVRASLDPLEGLGE